MFKLGISMCKGVIATEIESLEARLATAEVKLAFANKQLAEIESHTRRYYYRRDFGYNSGTGKNLYALHILGTLNDKQIRGAE